MHVEGNMRVLILFQRAVGRCKTVGRNFASHPGVQSLKWALMDANKSGTAEAISLRLLYFARAEGFFEVISKGQI